MKQALNNLSNYLDIHIISFNPQNNLYKVDIIIPLLLFLLRV